MLKRLPALALLVCFYAFAACGLFVAADIADAARSMPIASRVSGYSFAILLSVTCAAVILLTPILLYPDE